MLIITIIEKYNNNIDIDWDYSFSFNGFKRYLNEIKTNDYLLCIDKEGISTTLKHAQMKKLISYDVSSKEEFGLRIADITVGFISKFICAFENELSAKNDVEYKEKKVLSKPWFYITKETYELIEKLSHFLLIRNNAWYKYYTGVYGDYLIVLICYLKYITSYNNVIEFKKVDVEDHVKFFNSYCVEAINERYKLVFGKSIDIKYETLKEVSE